MKTAVLISGIPRHLERGYQSLFSSIIGPNNADVFVHAWFDPSKDGNIDKTVLDLYKPVRYLMEKPRTFFDSSMNLDRMMNSYARPYQRDKFLDTTYSMWYSIQQSNLIKEQYRLENNLYYDYVVRARFDMTYTMKILLHEFDRNILHISTRGLLPGMVDDRFAFASNSIMNAYCGGFNFLTHVFDIKDKQDGVFCGEVLVCEMLAKWGIPHKQIDGLVCHHLNHG